MIVIRQRIIDTIKGEFPALGESVRAFTGRFDATQEGQLSYGAPAIILAILPVTEAPKEVDPWPLQLSFGAAVIAKAPKASDADKMGWTMALQVAKIVYRNCWGFQNGMDITPAVIDSIQKNEQVNPQGVPTGVYYWTVQFHNFATFEVVLGEERA